MNNTMLDSLRNFFIGDSLFLNLSAPQVFVLGVIALLTVAAHTIEGGGLHTVGWVLAFVSTGIYFSEMNFWLKGGNSHGR